MLHEKGEDGQIGKENVELAMLDFTNLENYFFVI
jgi:hypothetical protein